MQWIKMPLKKSKNARTNEFPEEWRRKSNEPGKWTYRSNIPKAFADSFKTLIMHSKEINRKHREHEREEKKFIFCILKFPN